MIELTLTNNNNDMHRYSLACTGLKCKSYEFFSRILAEKKMHKLMKRHKLYVEEIFDDKHYKTYVCNNNVRFYIGRI